MKVTKGFSFDDVLLKPKYSEINSRSEVDTSVDLGKGIVLKIPIISANMKSITGIVMATAIAELGGMALLHRFVDNPETGIFDMWKQVCNKRPDLHNNVGVSVGVQDIDYKIVDSCFGWTKIWCVDVAHAHSKRAGEIVKYIAKHDPDTLLIAGNVATSAGAEMLSDCGADVIKASIGGGSLCTTRLETGNGISTFSALVDIYENKKNNYKIIADGGLRKAGDIVKSLCFSDAVMLGNMLAGTDETPGHDIIIDDQHYKEYAGSSTHKTNNIEGISALVKIKGPVKNVIQKIMEGLRSGMSYQGVSNLVDLKKDPEFIEISNSGLVESHPHDVHIRG